MAIHVMQLNFIFYKSRTSFNAKGYTKFLGIDIHGELRFGID
jgi:hypothetical protein